MSEIERFLASINYNQMPFKMAEIKKVVLNKKEQIFEVYLENPKAVAMEEAKYLFSCAENGINGQNKCRIHLTYQNIDADILKEYWNYFLDEIIIAHPSLINLKKASVEIENKTIKINVASMMEKNE